MGGEDRTRADEGLQFSVNEAVGAEIALPENTGRSLSSGHAGAWAKAASLLRASTRQMPVLSLEPIGAAFARERDLGAGFLFIPVFMAGGALAYFILEREPGWVSLLLATSVLACLAVVSRGREVLHAAFLAGLMTLAGMVSAKFETWRADTMMLGAEISTRMTARVVRIENQASGRHRLTMDVTATERPELRYAPERVRATARTIPDGLRPGDTVMGVVRLMPASGPVRPQSYDFSFNSYFDGIGAIGFFLTDPEIVDTGRVATLAERAAAWIENRRSMMATHIETQIGGAEGAIAAALITGIRASIPEEINEALRIVGLYHVISISGLHMALVAGTLMVGVRCCFALAPSFAARHPAKKYAAVVALAATAFYLAMSGADVAAQRSFLMLAVMLLAVMADRAALTMRNLAVSAIIILIFAPHEVVGPSFQMSFAATAALVAAYAAWTGHRESRRTRGKIVKRSLPVSAMRTGVKYAVGLSMTSVVAGLATALFTAWHFQQVSPLGLVANLTAMPFVSAIVMPMAVVACLLMPFGLDALPLQAMGWGIGAMNDIALGLAEHSAYDSTGTIPLGAVLLLTVALAILTMASGVLRWIAAPFAVIGIALLFLRQVPDVIVSEDARMGALKLSDGRVAINRVRPRGFVMQNWMRAFGDGELVPPAKVGTIDGFPEGEHAFLCDEEVCVARHESGAMVVYATSGDAAARACNDAALIVIDDATAVPPCAGDTVLIVTKRDLARWGSMEMTIAGSMTAPETRTQGGRTSQPASSGVEFKALFAIREPYRSWHEHRQFSREARGLAPYQRQQKETAEDKSAD